MTLPQRPPRDGQMEEWQSEKFSDDVAIILIVGAALLTAGIGALLIVLFS